MFSEKLEILIGVKKRYLWIYIVVVSNMVFNVIGQNCQKIEAK